MMLYSSLLSSVPNIVHGFTTRNQGVSQPPFHSLNLSYAIQGLTHQDLPEHVSQNRQHVLDALHITDASFVSIQQVHGAEVVHIIDAASKHVGDAMYTHKPGLALGILTADCVPILIASPTGNMVAAVHAGWKGTVLHITQKTISYFEAQGYAAHTLLAAIGPAIGPCCFETQSETAEQILRAYPHAHQVRERYFNLWQLNHIDLLSAGLQAHHIETLEHCTVCSPHFFSHRRDSGQTGRQASVIAIRG